MNACTTTLTLLVFASLTLACGCQQQRRSAEIPPLAREIPEPAPERGSAATVGVLERDFSPRAQADEYYTFEPSEPTPEQKEILGIKEPREADALAFYEPPPNPEQGVHPLAERALDITQYGRAGIDPGFELLTPPRVAVYSSTRPYLGWWERRTPTAVRHELVESARYGVYLETRERLQFGPPREGAGRYPVRR